MAMNLCGERIYERFETELVTLDIRGIGNFRNEVVFVNVNEGRQLDNLSTIAGTNDKDNSFFLLKDKEKGVGGLCGSCIYFLPDQAELLVLRICVCGKKMFVEIWHKVI